MDSAKEISGNMSDNGENLAEDPTMKLEAFKSGKTKIKSSGNKTAKRISGSGRWRQRRC